jgi:hypothetical protein
MPGTVLWIPTFPYSKIPQLNFKNAAGEGNRVIHEKKEDPSPEPEANAPAAET